jgi:hypothetical protein
MVLLMVIEKYQVYAGAGTTSGPGFRDKWGPGCLPTMPALKTLRARIAPAGPDPCFL